MHYPSVATLAATTPKAFIVSTSDFGGAANPAGIAKRRQGDSLRDVVDSAAHQPEGDPADHCVGMAGYPDRGGVVTLAAVILDDAGHVGAIAVLENSFMRSPSPEGLWERRLMSC